MPEETCFNRWQILLSHLLRPLHPVPSSLLMIFARLLELPGGDVLRPEVNLVMCCVQQQASISVCTLD